MLSRSIEDGGSTLRDHIQPGGELGYFQARFNVYDQAGIACPTKMRPTVRRRWSCRAVDLLHSRCQRCQQAPGARPPARGPTRRQARSRRTTMTAAYRDIQVETKAASASSAAAISVQLAAVRRGNVARRRLAAAVDAPSGSTTACGGAVERIGVASGRLGVGFLQSAAARSTKSRSAKSIERT